MYLSYKKVSSNPGRVVGVNSIRYGKRR
jgi:hypothetical protein